MCLAPCRMHYSNLANRWQGHDWTYAGPHDPVKGTTGTQHKVVQRPWLPLGLWAWVASSGEPPGCASGLSGIVQPHPELKTIKQLDYGVPCTHSHSVMPGFSWNLLSPSRSLLFAYSWILFIIGGTPISESFTRPRSTNQHWWPCCGCKPSYRKEEVIGMSLQHSLIWFHFVNFVILIDTWICKQRKLRQSSFHKLAYFMILQNWMSLSSGVMFKP